MGTIVKPHPVKLIAGIIASSKEVFLLSEELLKKRLGPIDYRSQRIKFNFTTYYEKDMGQNLERVFIGFKRLIDPALLSKIKVFTDKIERRIAGNTKIIKRPVNIDPGYITAAKLILASTKDYSHRIYLSKGIYSEVTLCYEGGSFRPFDWSYPDYRSNEYIKIFNEIRGIFMRQWTLR